MEDLTEVQKQFVAAVLIIGLFVVFIKVLYERITGERFTLFNVFHPIQPIKVKERHFINSFLIPYQTFSQKDKKRFLKRFAWFKSKKHFVFYGDIENKEEIKAYVSASAVLMTLGMKSFSFQNSIVRIIIYPSKYYSNIAKQHHIGEYNPRLKTLVFSAEDLKQGFKIPNDNINLGIHEVGHALFFEKRTNSSWEARKFKVGLVKLKSVFNADDFQDRITESKHIRAYAKTNFVEFFAVLLETFFENPEGLEQEFPKLHFYLKKMLNYHF